MRPEVSWHAAELTILAVKLENQGKISRKGASFQSFYVQYTPVIYMYIYIYTFIFIFIFIFIYPILHQIILYIELFRERERVIPYFTKCHWVCPIIGLTYTAYVSQLGYSQNPLHINNLPWLINTHISTTIVDHQPFSNPQ